MKKFLVIITLFLGTVAIAQPLTPEPCPLENEPIDSTIEQSQPTFEKVMIAAFKTGNATTIASYFAANVDMSIDDKENLYSNKQGEQVLKNFFLSHKPSDFTIIHKGKSGQSENMIGELVTPGITYRVTINTKSVGSSKEITSLTIEQN